MDRQSTKKQQAHIINQADSDRRHCLIVETIIFNKRLLAMNEKLLEFLLEPRAAMTEDDL